ncbi:MAG TPA: hypothetical protein VNZ58_11395, partial [Thermomicrobiales bacterium]|nr:hypothetical protein [Thermomicrobiales bacterium]
MISRIATLFPRLVTLLMVAMIAAPGAMTRDAAAQQSTATQTSFTSALSDMTVDVAGDFQISTSDSGTYDTGAGETVTIDNGAVRVMIGFFDDTDDPETTIGLYSDGFASDFGDVTELDSGTTRGVFWNVSRAGDANDETIFYISVTSDVVGNVDVMTLMWGPESDFIGSLEDAQYDVTIDGDGIFAEADIDSLEAAIGGNGESATGTEGTGSGSSITKGGQGTTGSGTKPDATATETTASQGGTSGDVLTSEVTGIEIELGGDWTVQSSDVSDEGRLPEEIIQLQSGYANGYIVFSYDVDAQSARDSFLGGFDTSAQSRDTLAKDEESDRAWSLDHAILGDGTEVYVYVEVRAGIDPDYLVLSTILAKPADFMDEFTSAQDNILLDGESIFPDTDADEIEALITGGGQGTTQEQPTEVATATSGGENPRDHAKLPGKSGDDEIDSGNETETGATGTAATTD